MQHITGIILAGGKSKRMGTEKAKVVFRNKLLIEFPIGLLQPFCSQIIISSNSTSLLEYGYEIIADEFPNNGPLSGIYSCLKKSANNINVIVSCDMPLLPKELIAKMLDECNGHDLLMPYHHDFYEPLCAIYHKNLVPAIEQLFLRNQYSPLDLIQKVNFKKLDISEDDIFFNPEMFKNVNTPDDLK